MQHVLGFALSESIVSIRIAAVSEAEWAAWKDTACSLLFTPECAKQQFGALAVVNYADRPLLTIAVKTTAGRM
eukprot:2602804-Amphidinium_carterae.1